MQTTTRSNISLKNKIITGFSLALIVISVIGYSTYRSHLRLTAVIIRQTTPDFKLYKLKQILSNITDADASMHLYVLTGDESYLSPYLDLVNTIDNQIDTISQLTKDSPTQLQRVDSIKKLIQQKFLLMDKMLAVQSNGRMRNALQDVINTIEKQEDAPQPTTIQPNTVNKTDSVSTPRKSKKSMWSFVKKMFHKETKDTLQPKPVLPLALDVKPLTKESKKVKIVLAEASLKENLAKQKQSSEELTLSQQGQITMYNIRVMIAEMEHEELDKAKTTASGVLSLADKTTRLITILFVIATLALLLFLIIIIRDIKNNSIYNKALQDAKDISDQLAKAKQSFLANMSHEIRTPLNAIVGFSEQLNNSNLSTNQSQQANTIHKASQHLLSIVNDILDYAKIESGKISLENIPFSPESILQEVSSILQFEADRKAINLTYKIEANVPKCLVGDPLRIRQIIINLCANAIKFTDKGSVSISCKSEKKSNEKTNLTISVTDTGIGIAPNRLNSIFEEFSQADNTISRRYGGTGLGLTLCKLLAEAQQGSIEVESEAGKGSTFTLHLPLAIGDEVYVPKIEKSEANNFNGIKILIADDEEFNRALLCIILNNWGVKTDTAENGEQALHLYKNNHYDIILLDWQMPVMNGYEVLQHIKNSTKKTGTKVIAVTAINKSVLDKDDSLKLADGFLSKPFKEKELYALLNEVLNKKIKQYNIESLYAVCNNDDAFAASLLGIFIKNTKVHLQEMQEAIKTDNWKVVSALAHKMLPACRHLELADIIEDLIKLEAQTEDKDRLSKSVETITESFKTILPQLEIEQKTILQNIK